MKQLSIMACVLLLAGCTVGPDYARPHTDVPADFSEYENGVDTLPAAPVEEWWATFDDPMLNTLIERGIAANHSLQIAEARVREARAARGVAASALWPTLDGSAAWTRSQAPEVEGAGGPSISTGLSNGPGGVSRSTTVRSGDVSVTRSASGAGTSTSATYSPSAGTPDRTTDLFQAGFDAQWELDVFGGNRRAVEAADADVDATVESRRDVLVSVLAEIALNYVDLRAAQSRLAITQQNIDAQEQTVKITAERFKAGLSSELDAVRARAQLATTRTQVPLLETQIATAIHRLSVLLGQEPTALRDELRQPSPMPELPDSVLVGLPSDLLRRRPDIRAVERELAASTARIGVATADLFPKFYLTGGIAGQDGSLGILLEGPNQVWNFGPGVSWPIFQGGRIRANINVQNARQEQAAIAYERQILLALEEVENGLVSFHKEQIRREGLDLAVEENQRAVKLANERYVRGLEGFLNVLSAQQELFRTEDQLVQSDQFVLTSLVAIYKALGGGWEAYEPKAGTTDEGPDAAEAAAGPS